MIKTKFFGKVKNGKVILWDEQNYLLHKAKLEGKDIELTLAKYSEKRSLSMNSYHWGVVVDMISRETGNDPETVHRFLLGKNAPKKEIKMGNKIVMIPIGSSEMNTDQMLEFDKKNREWAGTPQPDGLGLIIPLPNECELDI